jgi:protein-glutamine gamma-glutamyltransferase
VGLSLGFASGFAPLARLPRDARDTLFLLAVIGWTVLPHLPHLPLWCSALTLAVLAWRARLATLNAALPSRWVIAWILVVALLLTAWSFGTVLGKEPGVTLAMVLMALKTLELRARRDAFVVFFLGFFLVLTHFLFSQSLLTAMAMLVSVWGLLTALVLAHMPVGQPSLKQAAGLAARTALLGAPIMVALFLLFPRIGPLWGVPQEGPTRTGLSNSMQLGSLAQVASDDSIAMRLRVLEGQLPPARTLYFRGPVLGTFDGREWRRLEPSFPRSLRPGAHLQPQGPALRYEITLEPNRITSVPLLEATTSTDLSGDNPLRQRTDLEWQAERPVAQRLRITAEAHASFRHGPLQPIVGLQDYLELPAGFNPRTLQWAASLRRDPRYAEADGRTLADAVMNHIRTAGFRYTLSPGTYGDEQGRHAIDEFWLDRREGFCEHFAAAFVVVMRALDVPARVVTGYQGADPMPVDGFVIVRQSAAHAWAEYWQSGVGWVRADPTAMVAPDRINASRQLAPAPGLVAGAIATFNPNLLRGLRDAWEALDNRWNQWVLHYSRGQQMDLLKRLGFEAPTWEDLAFVMVTVLAGASLIGVGWMAWTRRRQDPWARFFARLRGLLARIGVTSQAHQSPRQLAQGVRERFGARGETVARLLDELDQRRYAPGGSNTVPAGWLGRLQREVRLLSG